MTITKADLVQQIYEKKPDLIKSQAVEMVETFLRLSKKSLIEGDGLLLSGFGKFCVHKKKARRGRNPQTGETVILAERTVIVFKCSGKLREKMNAED
jgi:integration host factor subunit alpha